MQRGYYQQHKLISLYFKMGASAGVGAINSSVDLPDGSDISTIDSFVYNQVASIYAPDNDRFVNGIGDLPSDGTSTTPNLEIPTSSINSEICLSYMPVGGDNGFGYVTLYDGVQVAQHQFTQA